MYVQTVLYIQSTLPLRPRLASGGTLVGNFWNQNKHQLIDKLFKIRTQGFASPANPEFDIIYLLNKYLLYLYCGYQGEHSRVSTMNTHKFIMNTQCVHYDIGRVPQ